VFSRRHREGLIILGKAMEFIAGLMAHAGRSSSPARFVPAHLDHHGALAAMIAAWLSPGTGVALVGEPGSGRTCLLHALPTPAAAPPAWGTPSTGASCAGTPRSDPR